jgi:hypothetical protein
MTTNDNHECGWGEPGDFMAENGMSGEAVLDKLLPFPSVGTFFYGAIREALAASHFYSVSGGWYGNLSFCGDHCYVDNQQGEYAIVQFQENDCHGVLSSGDPWRKYDTNVGLASAPRRAKEALELLVAELNRWCSTSPTGLFWSDEGQLAGPEPFRVLYRFGFETMGSLLLTDKEWMPQFIEGCESRLETAEAIISVARAYYATRRAVVVEPEALELIFPEDSPARKGALATVSSAESAMFIVRPNHRGA